MDNAPKPLVSIILLAFNHLDYTKLCVESLLRYTSHIPFELITVNNGSSDGTARYFADLGHSKQLNFADNIGSDAAFNAGMKLAEGRYTAFLSNDLVLTPNWLDNLLVCLESDERIGMVVPACSAASNYQRVTLEYRDLEEMIQAAKLYNVSNPGRWEERVRLITYAFLMKTALLKKLGGFDEIFSPGGFDDDDLSFRVRRAGYKLIFAADTFVHHFGTVTINQDYAKLDLLAKNRRIFYGKYEIDSWVSCSIDLELLSLLDVGDGRLQDVLVLTNSCGGTSLQLKNRLRAQGRAEPAVWTLTEEAHYLTDLVTASNDARCGRFEDIAAIYRDKRFDAILIEADLQSLDNPKAVLQAAVAVLREGGQLLLAAANALYYPNLINLLNGHVVCGENALSRNSFNPEKLLQFLADFGFSGIQAYYSQVPVPPEHRPLMNTLSTLAETTEKEAIEHLYASVRVIISAQGKSRRKNVLIYPGYDFWLKDGVFQDPKLGTFLGVDTGKNAFAVLREELQTHSILLRTIDLGNIERADCVLFCDSPKSYTNPVFRPNYHQVSLGQYYYQQWLKSGHKIPLILLLMEPPAVMPENYDRERHAQADVILTVLDDLVDNRKYFKYCYPQPLPMGNPFTVPMADKKLCAMIAANKCSSAEGELYGERRKAIEFFADKHPLDLELYGPGWKGCGYPCYKGLATGKMEVLSQYKFSLCYENGMYNGYITEKIFDCFLAGCVPIYLGAPNITEYIPEDTFIDRRRFPGYEELYRYISMLTASEYSTYLGNIQRFLGSESFQRFSYAGFAAAIAKVLTDHVL